MTTYFKCDICNEEIQVSENNICKIRLNNLIYKSDFDVCLNCQKLIRSYILKLQEERQAK